ncbi:MAG: hypothetical protein J7M05_14605 [Anaerolineae bacterium]|nr:hypothetical protein [Anaerolineae bacterium]
MKKSIWIAIGVLAFLWVAAATTQLRAAPSPTTSLQTSGGAPLQETLPPTIPPTLPPEPTLTPTPTITVEASLEAGPARLCPGWKLYYTLQVTNTTSFDLNHLVITSQIPVGTWYAPGNAGGTISVTFDAETNTLFWQNREFPVGAMIEANLVLHTYSNLSNGTVITTTFHCQTDELPTPLVLQATHRVDSGICNPTNTPTPSATPTALPTATPTITPSPTPYKWRTLFLPLLWNQ